MSRKKEKKGSGERERYDAVREFACRGVQETQGTTARRRELGKCGKEKGARGSETGSGGKTGIAQKIFEKCPGSGRKEDCEGGDDESDRVPARKTEDHHSKRPDMVSLQERRAEGGACRRRLMKRGRQGPSIKDGGGNLGKKKKQKHL